MMSPRHYLLLPAAMLLTTGLACGRAAVPSESPTKSPTLIPTPASTPTPYPTPIPPASTPVELPEDSGLRNLIKYANTMRPVIEDAAAILQRDAEIFKEAEAGSDAVLCDGRLEGDNESMKVVIGRARVIVPPSDAKRIHDLVLQSSDSWALALDNIERFCQTGNAFYKVPAALRFWEASLALQDAGNRFWALVIAEGVQDWVQR